MYAPSPMSSTNSSKHFETLVELLRSRAAYGSRVAFTFLADGEAEGPHLTYEELEKRARSICVANSTSELFKAISLLGCMKFLSHPILGRIVVIRCRCRKLVLAGDADSCAVFEHAYKAVRSAHLATADVAGGPPRSAVVAIWRVIVGGYVVHHATPPKIFGFQ